MRRAESEKWEVGGCAVSLVGWGCISCPKEAAGRADEA